MAKTNKGHSFGILSSKPTMITYWTQSISDEESMKLKQNWSLYLKGKMYPKNKKLCR